MVRQLYKLQQYIIICYIVVQISNSHIMNWKPKYQKVKFTYPVHKFVYKQFKNNCNFSNSFHIFHRKYFICQSNHMENYLTFALNMHMYACVCVCIDHIKCQQLNFLSHVIDFKPDFRLPLSLCWCPYCSCHCCCVHCSVNNILVGFTNEILMLNHILGYGLQIVKFISKGCSLLLLLASE